MYCYLVTDFTLKYLTQQHGTLNHCWIRVGPSSTTALSKQWFNVPPFLGTSDESRSSETTYMLTVLSCKVKSQYLLTHSTSKQILAFAELLYLKTPRQILMSTFSVLGVGKFCCHIILPPKQSIFLPRFVSPSKKNFLAPSYISPDITALHYLLLFLVYNILPRNNIHHVSNCRLG